MMIFSHRLGMAKFQQGSRIGVSSLPATALRGSFGCEATQGDFRAGSQLYPYRARAGCRLRIDAVSVRINLEEMGVTK